MDKSELFRKVSTPGSVMIDQDQIADMLVSGERVYGFTGHEIARIYAVDDKTVEKCQFLWIAAGSIPIRKV